MVREELRDASDLLREAAVTTTDADLEETLYDHSNQLAGLATADSGPDHGRLARHMHTLDSIQDDLDDDAAALVADAYDKVKAYRSTVEGV